MFITEQQIVDWLDLCGVTNYTINSNLTVDVNGLVRLPTRDVMPMDCLPVQFGEIRGAFIAIHNNYKDFTGFPTKVTENLSVNGSYIESFNNVPLDCGSVLLKRAPYVTAFSFNNTPFERGIKTGDASIREEFSEYCKKVNDNNKESKMSETYKKLKSDIVAAMKAKHPTRVQILRGLDGAIQLKAKNDLVEIDESLVITVIEKGIKQRNESIEAYTKGNRPDLVATEMIELGIYQGYLPEQLTDAEIEEIVDVAISSTGASTIKDMGSVNKIIMPQIKGKADGKRVSEIIKGKLK